MRTRVIVLDGRANLFALVDERGDTIGTGSKEVCDALAKMATSAATSKVQYLLPERLKSHDNIRSAIRI